MNRMLTWVLSLVAIILIVGGVWALTKKDDKPGTAETNTTTTANTEPAPIATQPEPTNTAEKATITFDGQSFSPAALTVTAGTRLTVVNNSDRAIEFMSDPHPSHTDNGELNIGTIAAGQSGSATLNEKGEWGYHDHLNPTETGSITVR